MRTSDGAGTRVASHGATSTRRALPTSPLAAACAIQPAGAAIVSTPARHETTIPPTWTRPISGTATRLSRRPALVTREKAHALTGISAISTVIDTTIDAISYPVTRWRHVVGDLEDTARRAPSNNAAVAPKVRMKPASRTSSGRTQTMTAAAMARACHGELR